MVQVGFKTHLGRCRERNEDNLFVDAELGLFIVADGMGGHENGDLASSIAVVEISNHIRDQIPRGRESREVVEEAVKKANDEIIRRTPAQSDEAEMGSTVVLALIRDSRVLIAHVGDSRAYMVTNGNMKQLTHDHTFVSDWVRDGRITIEEARNHEFRHGLYATVGIDDEIECETSDHPWEDNSCLLLCSDGLTEMLPDEIIEAMVNASDNPQEACNLLVEAANEMGGADNISVIVIRQASEQPH